MYAPDVIIPNTTSINPIYTGACPVFTATTISALEVLFSLSFSCNNPSLNTSPISATFIIVWLSPVSIVLVNTNFIVFSSPGLISSSVSDAVYKAPFS